MYNIDQVQQRMSSQPPQSLTGRQLQGNATTKFDCAKECPCGVPVIPVPDQWLEVIVTGGFKVWHIIFIIIAFVVSLIVIYCCFHRCRIPRTKQEIEADLMRSNLTTKFNEYLQELPNEPTTFVEALKKVLELDEKFEEDATLTRDLGARKRKGWLKLKGNNKADEQQVAEAQPAPPSAEETKGGLEPQVEPKSVAAAPEVAPQPEPTPGGEAELAKQQQQKVSSAKAAATTTATAPATTAAATTTSETHTKRKRGEPTNKQPPDATAKTPSRRKRDKPNLSRTKATHAKIRGGESIESPLPAAANLLEPPNNKPQHHQHNSHKTRPDSPQQANKERASKVVVDETLAKSAKQRRAKQKAESGGEATRINIPPK